MKTFSQRCVKTYRRADEPSSPATGAPPGILRAREAHLLLKDMVRSSAMRTRLLSRVQPPGCAEAGMRVSTPRPCPGHPGRRSAAAVARVCARLRALRGGAEWIRVCESTSAFGVLR